MNRRKLFGAVAILAMGLIGVGAGGAEGKGPKPACACESTAKSCCEKGAPASKPACARCGESCGCQGCSCDA